MAPREHDDVCAPDSTLSFSNGKDASSDFLWSARDEPHCTRRKLIMEAHPEVKTLMGPCPLTKWKVIGTVIFQAIAAYNLRNASWPVLLFFTYVVSGTLNHMMTLAIHELSHNLGFKERRYNRYLALLANVPMGLPAAISFKRYHLEHHKYQGEHIVDVDIPSEIEGKLFQSRIGKFIWLILQPLFYSCRPLVLNPKVPGRWEYINFALLFATDLAVFTLMGPKSLFYLICGTLLGMGVHPVAGHFVAEHYILNPGYETMSYYGPLNWVTFNVGYHNEHHDFPNVPGSRLHLLRDMCPEFYDTLPQYESWSKVLFDYVTRVEITPFSRVKRQFFSEEDRKKLSERELKAHLAS
eukprot:m.335700 g.335700  ORF g.335700 m.335700 type:complete len:353 (+) comp17656_c0_seq1:50-1108(+)